MEDLLYKIKNEISTSYKTEWEMNQAMIEVLSENLKMYSKIARARGCLDKFTESLVNWIEKIWKEGQEKKALFALNVIWYADGQDYSDFIKK